ncbi:hypothetical protein AVEN_155316-1 [Araneus ventricosus]|uniref:Peptidase aspartic putative domain-containing protein n=1 Tax=Araneus ventricosus TaxID=182803 RepID=A0A4Y2XAW6_ARAVE|nr:hypothetical protein AVEN_38647-1 [Araneus ventricosus]GBO46094.1 hypothetical protein AVEN_155316-1 [Araneus ventricosus]
MPSEERQKAVQNSRSCYLCLEKGHVIAKCRRKTSCVICGKKHHILLCRNIQAGSKSPISVNIRKDESKETVPQRDETLANLARTPNVLLQTLMVTLRGRDKKKKRQARAIIDSASQRSYILKCTADEMQFESSCKEELSHSLFGGTCNDIINHDVFTVFLSKTDGTYHCNFKALGQDVICGNALGILDPPEKKNKLELQEEARDHFLSTVKVNEEGRFQVSLPWLDNLLPFKDNYDLAIKRLDSTVKRFKAEKIYDPYGEVFNEWKREGIIEEVPKTEIHLPCHYLPHCHVVKENSTTRIRLVFDASAKQKGSPSLNDCLEKGLNLIELIPSILHRFRMNRIGVSTDIRKAFLQISLYPKDKDYLRFLWYGTDGKLKYYRHCRSRVVLSCLFP